MRWCVNPTWSYSHAPSTVPLPCKAQKCRNTCYFFRLHTEHQAQGSSLGSLRLTWTSCPVLFPRFWAGCSSGEGPVSRIDQYGEFLTFSFFPSKSRGLSVVGKLILKYYLCFKTLQLWHKVGALSSVR